MMRQFALGAAQSAIQPVADFLAPPVQVPTSVGKYKSYTEKNRFHIPSTLRAIGGRATEIRFEASDETYNCQPHALDYPIDNLEQLEARSLENMLQEGATAIAEVAGLSHEKTVIDAALAAAGAGTDVNATTSTTDLVDLIDIEIANVILAAKYGSLMGVGIIMGTQAFRRLKNHPLVRARFTVGTGTNRGNGRSGGNQGGAASINPSVDDLRGLFMGNPDTMVSFMCYDDNGPGEAADMKFLLENGVLIFARSPSPTRRDPSFMKTFRLANEWMKPGSYSRDDGRVEVAKFDWSEDVKVTNSAAVKRLNFNAS
jgi:hypothetical protein